MADRRRRAALRRLAVAAAELNATLWERRQAARRSADR